MKRVPLALAAPLLLAGCGQESAADKEAAALKRAAGQSAPEAEDILRNAAPGTNVQEKAPPKVPAEEKGQ